MKSYTEAKCTIILLRIYLILTMKFGIKILLKSLLMKKRLRLH